MHKLKDRLIELRAKGEKIAQENFIKNRVSDDIQKQRYDICLACPHLRLKSNTCKVCGCFMGVKTWMSNQKCPLAKWGKVNSENDT
jgi:hypothetical protein